MSMSAQALDQRRRPILRWLWVFAVLAVVSVAAATRWIRQPLPAPVVALTLNGFRTTSSNSYAIIAMTNLGPTRVYLRGDSWQLEFETEDGRATNRSYFRVSLPYPYEQSEGRDFLVALHAGANRWRVVGWYEWMDHRDPELEAVEWLERHLKEGALRRAVEWALSPFLDGRPEQFELYGSVATPWFSDLPPASAPQ
ncbi:MAG TPA: hypothetical protein DCY13_07480 [Verrucomicrobiales bacterium]|nr:hypothetical protein [Verrucomicrobiales bacterium]